MIAVMCVIGVVIALSLFLIDPHWRHTFIAVLFAGIGALHYVS